MEFQTLNVWRMLVVELILKSLYFWVSEVIIVSYSVFQSSDFTSEIVGFFVEIEFQPFVLIDESFDFLRFHV